MQVVVRNTGYSDAGAEQLEEGTAVHAALFVDEVRDGIPGEQCRERHREGREEALTAREQAVRREKDVRALRRGYGLGPVERLNDHPVDARGVLPQQRQTRRNIRQRHTCGAERRRAEPAKAHASAELEDGLARDEMRVRFQKARQDLCGNQIYGALV